MISLMLDYAAGGRKDNLFPFHRTSLAIHAANTALVIVLLYLLFGNIWAAAAVGLLFGVHPMTVETISWTSERKTLLAAFFAFWSLVFYVRFGRTNSKKYYAGCLFAYLLALMSKPTSLPLPFVMLLMDYWPLNRLNRQTVLEKLPLFALALVFTIITLISQLFSGGISLPGQGQHYLQNAPLIIFHNIVFYPCKMLWPVNLTSHYAYPQPFAISNPKVLVGIGGTTLLIVLLAASRRWTKAVPTGWLIFFVAILPTMQIIRFSDVIASDKFAYLPSIGLLMILASFLLWLYNARVKRAICIAIVVLLMAGSEAVATRRYIVYWVDTITLYKHMLSLAPNSVPLHGNLAIIYGRLGRNEEAVKLLKRTISINPYESNAYFNLGVAYLKLNQFQQAIDTLIVGIRLRPDRADAYSGLGYAYNALGRFEEAIEFCNRAIELDPDSAEAYSTLGSAYGKLGRYGEAVEAYKRAVEIRPTDVKAQYSLSLAYFKNGDSDAARQQCEILMQLNPNLADSLRTLINQ